MIIMESTIADLEIALDEIVSIGGLSSLLNFFVTRAGVTLGDVFSDRSLEQYRLLTHVSDLAQRP